MEKGRDGMRLDMDKCRGSTPGASQVQIESKPPYTTTSPHKLGTHTPRGVLYRSQSIFTCTCMFTWILSWMDDSILFLRFQLENLRFIPSMKLFCPSCKGIVYTSPLSILVQCLKKMMLLLCWFLARFLDLVPYEISSTSSDRTYRRDIPVCANPYEGAVYNFAWSGPVTIRWCRIRVQP